MGMLEVVSIVFMCSTALSTGMCWWRERKDADGFVFWVWLPMWAGWLVWVNVMVWTLGNAS